MKFYRGITVSPNDREVVIADILSSGLYVNGKATWNFEMADLRSHIASLFDKVDLSLHDTRPDTGVYVGYPAICACGDELGATYYATQHNLSLVHSEPLVISFEATIDDVWVDGRDFLYNFVFQQGKTEEQFKLALELFGAPLEKYLVKAWSTSNQDYRVAMCDLAINDQEVIKAHYNNNLVIGGRYNTTFKSAFHVKLPITPDRILSVAAPNSITLHVDISKEQFKMLG